MIPIGDSNHDRIRTPYINYILIAANILVFIFLQQMGTNEAFLLTYATIPEEILSGNDITYNGLGVNPFPVYITLLTAMFMHGSLSHLGGNLLYLWVFGDNLENVMGHVKYLVFYILTGLIATFSHVFVSWFTGSDLLIPSLGASGAISGVLGGYLLMFPRNNVRVFLVGAIIHVPAFISLGLWIILQLLSGWGSLGSSGGGVAYAAHIGGFFAGMLLVKVFAGRPAEVKKRY